MSNRISVSVLVAVGAALPAQQSAGPLAGAPIAIAVDGGTSGLADAVPLLHKSGFNPSFQQFPAMPTQPNLQAILAYYGGPNIDVDDISTGRDDAMVDSNGVLAVPPFGWGEFTFSFKSGAVGQPNSRLAAEPASGRGAAVFTWILPGSAVPAALQNRVERSHGRTELGVAAFGEVDSLDQPIVLGVDQTTMTATEPGFAALQPAVASIYFTVGGNSLAAVPPAWWATTNQPAQPSGATIFVTHKSVTAGVWTPPVVFKTYVELGLNAAEDIDALAYDETSQYLIFSCVGNARDQLLFLDLSTDIANPVPVVTTSNQPVSQAVGAGGNDDIDAVCTLDPRVRQGAYVADDFGASCGTPMPAYLPNLYPVGMSASASRRFAGGQRFYDSWVIGWPPLTGRGPGFAFCVLTLGDALVPAITAGVFVRDPNDPIAGNPMRFTQPIPATFALSGFPLMFRWFASDAGSTEISQAYPIRAFL